jgi:hypothetical protein
LNKLVVILILFIFVIGIITISLHPDNFVDANSTKKIQFTKTITSSQDPGQGNENQQLILILSPNKDTLYDGSITFSSSEPVQVAILHEISANDAKGQPTWTVDGNTIYALSLIDPVTKSDSIEFTGAALALHSPNSKEFTATISVDGWIRGQPTEVIMQKIEPEKNPSLLLSLANVPATIPMHEGLYYGDPIYYIITDSSHQDYAKMLTAKQGWKVEVAPSIKKIPENILQKIFIFKNGIKGNGINDYQKEIFTSTPYQKSEYTSLNSVIEVTWKKGQNATLLKSSEEIIDAEKSGRVEFNETGVVINAPQIMWPKGQMLVREDKEISDGLTFGGGQIIEINKEEMKVTFVAHRAWGPDGKTIYHIITDATPSGPADMMGVPSLPSSFNLITNSSRADLFQFKNGIKGSGSLGFQPSISTATPGDENYSPIWRVYVVEWNNPKNAKILETIYDINSSKTADLISVNLARTMNSNTIVNFPFIDPFQ